nr:MAG TPA: hypothetical protein [Caudoviricetes sp.]
MSTGSRPRLIELAQCCSGSSPLLPTNKNL